jgi:putative transposase
MPKIGKVKMTELLRFPGKILGATVSRTADRWHVAVQVEVPDSEYFQERAKNKITGIDLGISAAATLSDGRKLHSPRPLKAALRRLKIRGRKLSHKFKSAKTRAGFDSNEPLPKNTRLEKTNNYNKLSRRLARTYARISNIRLDFTHKLTTKLCRESQAIAMEGLNVSGMLKNRRLALAINDIGFYRIRTQLEYKAKRYGTNLIIADQWYPSTKTCSGCGHILKELSLSARQWICPDCFSEHDRDINAAKNLKRLATGTALPLASPSGNGGAADGMVPDAAGKDTPARYDLGFQSGSGREQNSGQTHLCSLF